MKLVFTFTPMQLIAIGAYIGTLTTMGLLACLYHLSKPNLFLLTETFQGWVTGIMTAIGTIGIVWALIKARKAVTK